MKKVLSDKGNVNLLWTGGWDSTFQLLQLLITHKCQVTPFYLIDAPRLSTGLELLTMKRIKDRLLKEYPHTHKLLQPTQYFAVADISPDLEITEAFQSLRKEAYMGSQYVFLSCFCKENEISEMQLCIHRDDMAYFFLEQIVSERTDDFQTVFRVDPQFREMNEYVLFRYFAFPIFKLSKIQMGAIANRQGWKEIMGMTWFCHTPTNKMMPCGKCNPCMYTIKEGLGWRIPVRRRMVSFFYRLHRLLIRRRRSIAKIILKKLGLFKYVRSLFKYVRRSA